MYGELYEIWRKELEVSEIGELPSDFYAKVADYLRRLREEGRMLDRRTVKARLLEVEIKNAKRMLRELLSARCGKLSRKIARGEGIPMDALAVEEEKICSGVLSLTESYRDFSKNLLRGHLTRIVALGKRKSAVLRFLSDVPAIIGADMRAYGPFKVEDVASLPIENAKILIKQSLAEKVEVDESMDKS